MTSNYEIEVIKLKEFLGVDLLPKYLTPIQQVILLQAMLKDIQEEDDKIENNT